MLRNEPEVESSGIDRNLMEVLAELESAENYKAWLLALARPHLRGRILEIGAGRGTYSDELRAFGTSLTALEPSAEVCSQLRSRFPAGSGTEVVEGTVSSMVGRTFDSAIALNVVEHVENDTALLHETFELLSPGGTFVIWVPAFQSLYGRFDREIGHFRRYRRPQLRARLESAGFEVERCSYKNLPGFGAWWLMIKVLGQRPTTGGLGNVYDRWIVPPTRWIESKFSVPVGQSVFAVGRKPGPVACSNSTTHDALPTGMRGGRTTRRFGDVRGIRRFGSGGRARGGTV